MSEKANLLDWHLLALPVYTTIHGYLKVVMFNVITHKNRLFINSISYFMQLGL